MSLDPSRDLQKAIVAALKADPDVVALVGQRIYDAVPSGAAFPYVTIGGDEVTQDDAECLEAFDIFSQIDVWSRAVGQPEMKQIAGAVRAVLHDAVLTLDDYALVSLQHQITRYLVDPDGTTHHAAISLRALIDGESSQN